MPLLDVVGNIGAVDPAHIAGIELKTGTVLLDDAVMVKFTLLMSKNILSTDSIFILAVVVALLGITSASVPSLTVLSDRTNGKVRPPSELSVIFTLAQLIGARLVPLTLQVMV
jgi:hypothetical protein